MDCSHEDQFHDLMKSSSPKEIEDWKNQSANVEQTFNEMLLSAKKVKEIRKKDALRNIPIIVLTADHKSVDTFKEWKNYQNDIASLSDKAKHISIENCGHYIQVEKPQIVINAINEIINKVEK